MSKLEETLAEEIEKLAETGGSLNLENEFCTPVVISFPVQIVGCYFVFYNTVYYTILYSLIHWSEMYSCEIFLICMRPKNVFSFFPTELKAAQKYSSMLCMCFPIQILKYCDFFFVQVSFFSFMKWT